MEHPHTATSVDLTPFCQVVPKPWGHELIFTRPEQSYCGKVLYVDAGKRLSLQVHDQKLETIMLLEGDGLLVCDNAAGDLVEVQMQPRTGYTIVPGQRHRLIAVARCIFIESSTPESGTTYRLHDDTGRTDETEAVRSRERNAQGERDRDAGSGRRHP